MREELAKINDVRRAFKGTFVRFGKKSGYKGPETTVLPKNIVDVTTGKVVTDHLWFTMGMRLACLDLKESDVVRFEARVTQYLKGYRGRRDEDDFGGDYKPLEYDYRLSFPSKMVKIPVSNPNQLQLS